MTLEQLPLIMLRALALTIIIECMIAWSLGIRDRHGQITVALANLLTNPLVVSLGAATGFFIGPEAILPATLLMEIMAILAEGRVYEEMLQTARNPYVVSLICNAVSYGIGEILNRFVF